MSTLSLFGSGTSRNSGILTWMLVLLRAYQNQAVEDIRAAFRAGAMAVLFQLSTGGGKTLIFSAISVAALARRRRTVVLVHRIELLKQAVRKLAEAGVEAGIIAAGWPSHPERPVQVAMVQTLVHRLDKIEPFQFVVVDEAHHCRARTYERIVAAWPKSWVLGVSATPCRGDGKGLGRAAGGIFDVLVCGPSIKQLIADRYLAPVKVYVPANAITPADLADVGTKRGDYETKSLGAAVDRADITGDAVAEYATRADHQPCVAFCYSVRHAQAVAAQFREAGYRAQAVYGAMPAAERDRILSGLGTGEIEVVTSCDLISEGLDIPSVSIVILLRPTKSIVTFLQQIGRGMRPAPEKTLIVVDLAGNSLRLGRPTADRKWSLDGAPAVEDKVKLGGGSRGPARCRRHWTGTDRRSGRRAGRVR